MYKFVEYKIYKFEEKGGYTNTRISTALYYDKPKERDTEKIINKMSKVKTKRS